jgi:uncharacterized protein YeeX (DUF496 family)
MATVPTTIEVVSTSLKNAFSYVLLTYASFKNAYEEAIQEYTISVEANARLANEKREARIKERLEQLRRNNS